ncbi:hypothetical protein GUJ93_ZPchr0012g19931 [Zizania palustris]|uniref:Uncharacterized protein n=1 Tax=Zizania palustris TaxID=103762 RepID=A0A8J6BW00_ZIZPA|nr:hypothetical protein GUJ93_ZPchr0012g19931 [Zizania palustris]
MHLQEYTWLSHSTLAQSHPAPHIPSKFLQLDGFPFFSMVGQHERMAMGGQHRWRHEGSNQIQMWVGKRGIDGNKRAATRGDGRAAPAVA